MCLARCYKTAAGGAANPQKSLPAAPFCLQARVYIQGASAPPRGWPNPSSHPPTDPLSRRPFCTWIYPVLSTAADTRSVKPSSSCTYAPSSPPFRILSIAASKHKQGAWGIPGRDLSKTSHVAPQATSAPANSKKNPRQAPPPAALKYHFAVIKITLNLARATVVTRLNLEP